MTPLLVCLTLGYGCRNLFFRAVSRVLCFLIFNVILLEPVSYVERKNGEVVVSAKFSYYGSIPTIIISYTYFEQEANCRSSFKNVQIPYEFSRKRLFFRV